MIKVIGIIGCGWLGYPLAKNLVQSGFSVNGSTTSKEKLLKLKSNHISPFLVSLHENKIEGDINGLLSGIDLLIINVPPKLRQEKAESYLEKMKLLVAKLEEKEIKKVLFISSTSVYGDLEGTVTEEAVPHPKTASGKQLLASEKLLIKSNTFVSTIIRFGGLIGPNRHPVTTLSGKTHLKNGHVPINLIHLDDCIHMIRTIIIHSYWGELFNGVYPHHPTKKEYYKTEAQKKGLAPPLYDIGFKKMRGKVVESRNFFVKKHGFNTSIVS